MTIATIEELAYLMKQAKDEGLPQPIVFLGAGASKTGGVPLASEIIADILEKYKDSPKIKALNDEPRTYSNLMECLTPFERNKLLKEYINNAKINVTHLYLAQLLIGGYVDYVLTVNFDNLMLRALALFNNFPATYDMAVLKDLTTTSFKEKSVIYLHGQHHGLWLLNTSEEMERVKEIIPPILNGIKNQRPWIFLGYSGEDPIFEHIIKLGRFDNGLFWVTYNENNPNHKVCQDLLEKSNTNAYLIKGFDSDSFILKLSAELGLEQPEIIDKPFSSLQTTLQNIVDIDDEEHFKGVKERLEIAKSDVVNAISQFEKGEIKSNKKLKLIIDINLLKKEIINKIIKNEFIDEDVEILEKSAIKLKNDEIDILLGTLYRRWGDFIKEKAEVKNNEELYLKSFEKYEKASNLNPLDSTIFNNWGNCIMNLAKHKKEEKLFKESFEKYKKSLAINAKNTQALVNWGSSIYELYLINNQVDLIEESIIKFKEAIDIEPKFSDAYYNWGTVVFQIGEVNNDETLLQESVELFTTAIKLNPKDSSAYCNNGIALKNLGGIKGDSSLYKLSIENLSKAIEINPNEAEFYQNLGNTYKEYAALENDENLFKKGFEFFKISTEINPLDYKPFYGWGATVLELYKLKKTKELFEQALELFNKNISLGGKYYNLACLYSIANIKEEALINLDTSLEKNEIKVDFVRSDSDWFHFLEDSEFIKLLEKDRSK